MVLLRKPVLKRRCQFLFCAKQPVCGHFRDPARRQTTSPSILATEPLETSKEELQSINEELQTVNQENRHKVEELSQLSADLTNLLSATDIATLFLDRELRILRFTPKLGELFSVRLTDRGRPISDLTTRLGYAEMQNDVGTVLSRLAPLEREVQDERGRWYLTRVLGIVKLSPERLKQPQQVVVGHTPEPCT